MLLRADAAAVCVTRAFCSVESVWLRPNADEPDVVVDDAESVVESGFSPLTQTTGLAATCAIPHARRRWDSGCEVSFNPALTCVLTSAIWILARAADANATAGGAVNECGAIDLGRSSRFSAIEFGAVFCCGRALESTDVLRLAVVPAVGGH